jgi:hypothetical protein
MCAVHRLKPIWHSARMRHAGPAYVILINSHAPPLEDLARREFIERGASWLEHSAFDQLPIKERVEGRGELDLRCSSVRASQMSVGSR